MALFRSEGEENSAVNEKHRIQMPAMHFFFCCSWVPAIHLMARQQAWKRHPCSGDGEPDAQKVYPHAHVTPLGGREDQT